jgi:hypothetical protein
MRTFVKLSALGAALALGTAFASAATITVGSSSATTNYYAVITSPTSPPPGPYPTVASFGAVGSGVATANLTNAFNVWDGPYAGSNYVGVTTSFGPDATSNPAYGYYLYGYTFTGAGTLTSLNVLADDTVSVFLGGSNIITPGSLGTDTHCSDNAPSCTLLKQGSFSGSVAVTAGETLWFIVEQAGVGPVGGTGDPSGLDFTLSYNTPGTVPEPNTLLMLGTGLIGSAGAMFRRMRSR